MKKIGINGSKFHSLNGFYNQVEKVLIHNLNWKWGRNLDSFADILEGGFGVHDYGENIEVTWKNYQKSSERLKHKELRDLAEILNEAQNVKFEIEQFD